jgi:hypothetical protein
MAGISTSEFLSNADNNTVDAPKSLWDVPHHSKPLLFHKSLIGPHWHQPNG